MYAYISVDLVPNDRVDIKAGGPPMLGFDFYVLDEERNEMMDFIKQELRKYGFWAWGVSVKGRNLQLVGQLWTKEMISKEIEEYIKSNRL